MTAHAVADLDRWVQQVEPKNARGRRARLSEFDTVPRLVLLGEPGIGKTTALRREAQRAKSRIVTVQALLSDPERYTSPTLFIDALDQARSRDRADEQVIALARAVRARRLLRWRLTCRSEDWRGRADLEALAAFEDGEDVVIVQLLPLDFTEAKAVLGAIGHLSPTTFLERAHARGAGGFTETPLMLELLYDVVSATDRWPATRFELFMQATRQLASEQNEARELRPRTDAPTLLEAAGRISLMLLCGGVETIWRSNRAPPVGTHPVLTRSDSGLEQAVLDDLLDSALFRGEWREFAPVHRTIAEFLAGRTLARAVVGGQGRAAYPLGRALALIADPSGRAPTELRGVYAWFVAHLVALGREDEGKRLLTLDPTSVLLYGDVAAFDTNSRRALLEALPAADPYFRAAARDANAIASLAGEDLAEDFRRILVGGPRADHLRLTVLDALAGGTPVPALVDVLHDIVHDDTRPDEHRGLAIDALLNAALDRSVEARRLYGSLSHLPTSNAREGLRARLLAEPSSTPVDAEAVADVLISYASLRDDDVVMRLYRLQLHLREAPCPDLLDALVRRRSALRKGRVGYGEIQTLLEEVFVAALDAVPDLEATRLVGWVDVLEDEGSGRPDKLVGAAIARWLERDNGREITLFEAIMARANPDSRWIAKAYEKVAGRPVSIAIVEQLMRTADRAGSAEEALKRFTVATDIVFFPHTDALLDGFWRVRSRLERDDRYAALFERLTRTDLDDWRREEIARKGYKRRREDVTTRWTLRRLRRSLEDLKRGYWPGAVIDGAKRYLSVKRADGPDNALQAVRDVYPGEITDAIVERWCTLAREGDPGIGPIELGEMHGRGVWYEDELCIVAGLNVLFEQGELGRPETVTPSALLCVLTQGSCIKDDAMRSRLERFAVTGLCWAAERRCALVAFWDAAFEAGARQLIAFGALEKNEDLLRPLIGPLVDRLTRQPDLSKDALRETMTLLVKADGHDRLPELIEAALETKLSDEACGFWLALGLELDPTRFRAHLARTTDRDLLTAALAEHAMGAFNGPLVLDDPTTRDERYALALKYLGPYVTPGERQGGGVVTAAVRRQDTVEKALSVLAADPSEESARRTRALLASPALSAWHPRLRHALAAQAAQRRDEAFRRPTPDEIDKALAGGPPVNASDLRAVVREELATMAETLHTDDTTPWKQFWNTDGSEKVERPRAENTCRDRILERLRDRLRPYRITAAVPEAERGEDQRADMLVLTSAGKNLPIEVKRHYNEDLWTAAENQLQPYADAPGADGLGIYLVLWFGCDWEPTYARPDKGEKPVTAIELEAQLRKDLPECLRHTTDIIVFDVSRPAASREGRSARSRKAVGKTGG